MKNLKVILLNLFVLIALLPYGCATTQKGTKKGTNNQAKKLSSDGAGFMVDNYGGAQFEREMCPKYKQADSTMHKMFAEIIEEYKADTVFIRKISRSQQLWEQLRSANIRAIFSDEVNPGFHYGRDMGGCECVIMKEETNRRIEFLKGWTEGIPEGDVCTGSRKMKR